MLPAIDFAASYRLSAQQRAEERAYRLKQYKASVVLHRIAADLHAPDTDLSRVLAALGLGR